LDNPLSYDLGLFMKHVVQRSILAPAPASPPARVATSEMVIILSGVESHVSVVQLWRPKIFLPVFWRPASIWVNDVDLLVRIFEAHCYLSALIVLGGSGGFVLLGNFSFLV
jgi:hypothetical protein